jgi:putative membrane protein
MAWVLAFHIISMVAWFAGLFYLPRLYVYHSIATDPVGIERFLVMERRLYWGIMTPAGILTLIFGGWLLVAGAGYYLTQVWMQVKLLFVVFLIVYHVLCGVWMKHFERSKNKHSQRYYRIANETPTVLLLVIVILVVVKPFPHSDLLRRELLLYNSTISKSDLFAPQSGQSQSSGTSSQRVPGSMPSSGQPSSSL